MPQEFFIEAIGYWEKLLMADNLISAEALLPQKIIRGS